MFADAGPGRGTSQSASRRKALSNAAHDVLQGAAAVRPGRLAERQAAPLLCRTTILFQPSTNSWLISGAAHRSGYPVSAREVTLAASPSGCSRPRSSSRRWRTVAATEAHRDNDVDRDTNEKDDGGGGGSRPPNLGRGDRRCDEDPCDGSSDQCSLDACLRESLGESHRPDGIPDRACTPGARRPVNRAAADASWPPTECRNSIRGAVLRVLSDDSFIGAIAAAASGAAGLRLDVVCHSAPGRRG
jgi:hypothetical protein